MNSIAPPWHMKIGSIEEENLPVLGAVGNLVYFLDKVLKMYYNYNYETPVDEINTGETKSVPRVHWQLSRNLC